MLTSTRTKVNIAEVIGKGYRQFWEFQGRYRVVKGGRGSKKSTTAAFWLIYNMMKYWHAYEVRPHALVVRRFYNTHRDSTFAQLRWCIHRLGVSHLWHSKRSPFELVYKPSGQRIMFRGLDDPQSIASITVEQGELCWTFWEEAFQVTNEDDFNQVDLTIRGQMEPPLFKQHTLIFNPWSEKIWLKKRFFDVVGSNGLDSTGDILAITRNYDSNEFLGDDDLQLFERMRASNPRRYAIEGQGEWGIAEGLVFDNWIELDFNADHMKRQLTRHDTPRYRELYGMDFGYTNDPTAFIALLVDEQEEEIYIYDEIYQTRMKNRDIYNAVSYKGYQNCVITGDSADPKTIDELKELGLHRMRGAGKGKGSVKAGIQKLQGYKMFVHPSCTNTIVELNNYIWAEDRSTGEALNEPADDYNHLMDALRYATEGLRESTFSW